MDLPRTFLRRWKKIKVMYVYLSANGSSCRRVAEMAKPESVSASNLRLRLLFPCF